MKKRILLLLVALFAINLASAATYYVSTNGNDNNAGTSTQPWATFSHAFSVMQGGDTLIVKDGTYTQQMSGMPSGTSGAYTNIKAENNFNVTVRAGRALYISGRSYVRIEGIKFDANSIGEAGTVSGSNHIKIIRCSFSGAGTSDWNILTFAITGGSSYILLEECWAWGTGRYKFIAYQSDHIIFRRCVARHDSHPSTQCAPFTRYDSPNVEFQNCIAIDSASTSADTDGTLWGGIWNENNGGVDTTGKDLGCIILNVLATGINDFKIKGTRTIENCAIVNAVMGMNVGDYLQLGGSASINHVTVIDMKDAGGFENGKGIITEADIRKITSSVRNSVISGCDVVGLSRISTSDYNDLYDNAANYYDVTLGAHDLNVNPSPKYITRIESNSPLKGAASDGGDIGANIIYRYGVSGTLWGETGYETLTNEPLWPFPNEAEIKKDMASYSGTGPNGKRGFAADGNGLYGGPITLTSYIWEYLSNACPNDICNYNIQYHPADTNQNNIIEMKELIAFIGLWKAGQANVNDVMTALDRWFRGV